MVSLTFYGGVDEIGGNKILLEDRDTRVLLDFGMSFKQSGPTSASSSAPENATAWETSSPQASYPTYPESTEQTTSGKWAEEERIAPWTRCC